MTGKIEELIKERNELCEKHIENLDDISLNDPDFMRMEEIMIEIKKLEEDE